MKHLKVRARLQADKQTVKVKILEQTHVGEEFGDYWDGEETFFAPNGTELISNSFPHFDEWCDEFYVRGCDEDLDDKEVTLTLRQWEKVKAAIEAYNTWGATQDD